MRRPAFVEIDGKRYLWRELEPCGARPVSSVLPLQ
jgi:hypothetical protein